MSVSDTILARDIEPSVDLREALLEAARQVPQRLAPADLAWARWLAGRLDVLIQGYRTRERLRLSTCASALQVAATESLFLLAIQPLAAQHQELNRRIAQCEAAGTASNLLFLPKFLPRSARSQCQGGWN